MKTIHRFDAFTLSNHFASACELFHAPLSDLQKQLLHKSMLLQFSHLMETGKHLSYADLIDNLRNDLTFVESVSLMSGFDIPDTANT